MQTFLDNKGRSWSLSIDADSAQKVWDTTRVALRQMCQSKMPNLPGAMNWELFTLLLFCLVEEQAQAQGIDQAEFLSGLATEKATNRALDSLVAEIMGDKDPAYHVKMRHAWECLIHHGCPPAPIAAPPVPAQVPAQPASAPVARPPAVTDAPKPK